MGSAKGDKPQTMESKTSRTLSLLKSLLPKRKKDKRKNEITKIDNEVTVKKNEIDHSVAAVAETLKKLNLRNVRSEIKDDFDIKTFKAERNDEIVFKREKNDHCVVKSEISEEFVVKSEKSEGVSVKTDQIDRITDYGIKKENVQGIEEDEINNFKFKIVEDERRNGRIDSQSSEDSGYADKEDLVLSVEKLSLEEKRDRKKQTVLISRAPIRNKFNYQATPYDIDKREIHQINQHALSGGQVIVNTTDSYTELDLALKQIESLSYQQNSSEDHWRDLDEIIHNDTLGYNNEIDDCKGYKDETFKVNLNNNIEATGYNESSIEAADVAIGYKTDANFNNVAVNNNADIEKVIGEQLERGVFNFDETLYDNLNGTSVYNGSPACNSSLAGSSPLYSDGSPYKSPDSASFYETPKKSFYENPGVLFGDISQKSPADVENMVTDISKSPYHNTGSNSSHDKTDFNEPNKRSLYENNQNVYTNNLYENTITDLTEEDIDLANTLFNFENSIFPTPPRSENIGSPESFRNSPDLSPCSLEKYQDLKLDITEKAKPKRTSSSSSYSLKNFKDMQKDILNEFAKKECCALKRRSCKEIFDDNMKQLDALERKNLCLKVSKLDIRMAFGVLEMVLIKLPPGIEPEPMRYALFALICQRVLAEKPDWFTGDFGLNLLKSSVLRCPQRVELTRFVVFSIHTAMKINKRLAEEKKDALFHEVDALGDNLLIACARGGDRYAPALAEVIAQGGIVPLFKVNHVNSDGHTALHVACNLHSAESSRLEIVHVLLEHAHADIWKGDVRGGDTALHLAVNSSKCDLKLILLLFTNVQRDNWKKLATYPNMSSISPKDYARTATRSRQNYPEEVLSFLSKCRQEPPKTKTG